MYYMSIIYLAFDKLIFNFTKLLFGLIQIIDSYFSF